MRTRKWAPHPAVLMQWRPSGSLRMGFKFGLLGFLCISNLLLEGGETNKAARSCCTCQDLFGSREDASSNPAAKPEVEAGDFLVQPGSAKS